MSELPPVTEEEFYADRKAFLHSFVKAGTYATIAVLAVVALLGIYWG